MSILDYIPYPLGFCVIKTAMRNFDNSSKSSVAQSFLQINLSCVLSCVVLVLNPHVFVACVQLSRVCICCVPLYNYVLHPRTQVNSALSHSSQNKLIVYLLLIDLCTVVDLCNFVFQAKALLNSQHASSIYALIELKHYGKMLYFPPRNRIGLRFWPHIVHVELFCHKLILGFLCQQVSMESLNLRQVTHFYIQLQRVGCV